MPCPGAQWLWGWRGRGRAGRWPRLLKHTPIRILTPLHLAPAPSSASCLSHYNSNTCSLKTIWKMWRSQKEIR